MDTLKLQKREVTGKKVQKLRDEGLIPAVIYDSKTESQNVLIDASDADWLYRNTTSTTILDTEFGKDKFKALVKEFHIDPVTEEILHISLFQIDENAPMLFSIPFNFLGVSPAVKNNLGVLVKVLDSIEVRCKLADLQPAIDIDIAVLKDIGDTVNITDIQLPKGMNIINEELENATIVTITEAQKIEEVEIVEEEGEEGEEVEGEEGVEGAEGVEGEEGETPKGEAPKGETPKEE